LGAVLEQVHWSQRTRSGKLPYRQEDKRDGSREKKRVHMHREEKWRDRDRDRERDRERERERERERDREIWGPFICSTLLAHLVPIGGNVSNRFPKACQWKCLCTNRVRVRSPGFET
jgi:hypothetical protein